MDASKIISAAITAWGAGDGDMKSAIVAALREMARQTTDKGDERGLGSYGRAAMIQRAMILEQIANELEQSHV